MDSLPKPHADALLSNLVRQTARDYNIVQLQQVYFEHENIKQYKAIAEKLCLEQGAHEQTQR